MNEAHRLNKPFNIQSLEISGVLCIVILLIFFYDSDQFLHWFIIPITLSGILIGIDAIDWLRGRLNLYDPIGILGLLGFHLFFLAPLLHISWDIWPPYISPPEDWRTWLGSMAFLNLLGLLTYRFVRGLSWPAIAKLRNNQQLTQTVWQLNHQRFVPVLCFALTVSAVLQLMVYQSFGGLMGFIQAASTENREASFTGMGWIFMLSENFPILAMMGFAVYARRNPKFQTWKVIVPVLLIFLVLQLLFGGLRGSRSNTVWALFWAAGIIHFWVRPISKKLVYIGLVFLLSFLYLYGFYKSAGLEDVLTLREQGAIVNLEAETGRSWKSLILQDLGRSDIQAFILYRILKSDSDYQLAWGRTYLGTIAILIPSSVWPDRPPSASKEGTEVQFGMGSYDPYDWSSSLVYGLTGETMLNFGPWVVPLAFIPFAWLVQIVRHWLLTWQIDDTRKALLPMLINLCFVFLISDSIDILFFLIKGGTVPFLVIWISSDKTLFNIPFDDFSLS